jgi:hypothetical protein
MRSCAFVCFGIGSGPASKSTGITTEQISSVLERTLYAHHPYKYRHTHTYRHAYIHTCVTYIYIYIYIIYILYILYYNIHIHAHTCSHAHAQKCRHAHTHTHALNMNNRPAQWTINLHNQLAHDHATCAIKVPCFQKD